MIGYRVERPNSSQDNPQSGIGRAGRQRVSVGKAAQATRGFTSPRIS